MKFLSHVKGGPLADGEKLAEKFLQLGVNDWGVNW